VPAVRRIARRHLLDIEAEQHLIFRQRLGPAAKTVPLHFSLMIWRSRSLSHCSASSIAFGVSRSSGNASLGTIESDHIRRQFATVSMRLFTSPQR